MRYLLALVIAAVTVAEVKAPVIAAEDRLAIREAQLDVAQAWIAYQNSVQKAQGVVAGMEKKYGCSVDVQRAECREKK